MTDDKIKYLIAAIAGNNDEYAFLQLYRHYFSGLLSFANSIIKNKQVSEEIVEDVFIKLWDNRNILPTIHNLSHYLYVATKHAAINQIKSKKNIMWDDLGDYFLLSTPESALVDNENTKIILTVINSLPPKCRLIFRLVKDEGLKYNEVAQLLNISVRTVNAQMCIAITRIIAELEKLLPEFAIYYSRKRSK